VLFSPIFTPMLSAHQLRTLRKLRALSGDWKQAKLPGVGERTWGALVTLGFLEEKQDEDHSGIRFVRLTEKGRRLVEDGRY
jgi:predicted transcriptional regulator with HTH domain